MIDETRALEIAEATLREWSCAEWPLAISDVEERLFGWIVFWTRQAALEYYAHGEASGYEWADIAIGGNSPFVVDRVDGHVGTFGTARGTEFYVRRYLAERPFRLNPLLNPEPALEVTAHHAALEGQDLRGVSSREELHALIGAPTRELQAERTGAPAAQVYDHYGIYALFSEEETAFGAVFDDADQAVEVGLPFPGDVRLGSARLVCQSGISAIEGSGLEWRSDGDDYVMLIPGGRVVATFMGKLIETDRRRRHRRITGLEIRYRA